MAKQGYLWHRSNVSVLLAYASYSSGIHRAQIPVVKNISQYSFAFHRTLFSDYSYGSMEYAVQVNHRHIFLSSDKIILILAESCVYVCIYLYHFSW